MAASKPTSSLLKKPDILSTELYLGTLAGDLGCFPLDNEAYPPLSDSCVALDGIQSLIGFSIPLGTIVHSVLYLRPSVHKASPQAISERTSYHGV